MNRNNTETKESNEITLGTGRVAVQRLDRRRQRSRLLATACAVCATVGWAPQLVRADVLVVDVVAVAEGYRASELKGKPVVNDTNEKIGTVDDLIVGKDRVLFAIIQAGGFLGLGSHYVAVPYSSLKISGTPAKIVLPGATKDEVKSLPEFKYKS